MAPPPTPSAGDAPAIVLDHVAVAVEQWSDAWPRYVGQLGGRWHSGGTNVGFSPAQLSFANKAKIEILQPWEPEGNPFLRRFLDHSGPGPHHLTFKVPDIRAVLARAGDAGFEPVNVRLIDPMWKEAFFHPRQASGVVVQVAQAEEEWLSPPPDDFPETSGTATASLHHVTHAVRDMDAALGLFQGLVQGTVADRGTGPDGSWEYVDLTWPGPLAVRLVSPTGDADLSSPLSAWMGTCPGRVHHLAFEVPGPLPAAPATGDIPGVPTGPGSVVAVAARDNLGTALVLRTGDGR